MKRSISSQLESRMVVIGSEERDAEVGRKRLTKGVFGSEAQEPTATDQLQFTGLRRLRILKRQKPPRSNAFRYTRGWHEVTGSSTTSTISFLSVMADMATQAQGCSVVRSTLRDVRYVKSECTLSGLTVLCRQYCTSPHSSLCQQNLTKIQIGCFP